MSSLLQRTGVRRQGPVDCGVSRAAAAGAFPLPVSWAPRFTGATLKTAAKAKCWGIRQLKAPWCPRALGFGWWEGACWSVNQPRSPRQAHSLHLGETVSILNHSVSLWAMAGVWLTLMVLLSACGWCVCHSASALLCGNCAFH